MLQWVQGQVRGCRHLVWAPAYWWYGGTSHEKWGRFCLGMQELWWRCAVRFCGPRIWWVMQSVGLCMMPFNLYVEQSKVWCFWWLKKLRTIQCCQSIVSDILFPPETSLYGLHLSLSTHSLLAYASPPSLSASLSCMYSFTLSFHLTTGLPLLLGSSISLTISLQTSLFYLSMCPNHLK